MGSDLEKFLESSKRYLNEKEKLEMSRRAFIDYLKLQITSHALTVGTIDKLRRARISTNRQKYLMKEHVVVATCARHYVVSFTVYCKTSFWTNLPYFVDKSPIILRTNIPRKWGQISIENDSFSGITRILLQIQGYLLIFPKICPFLTITIVFLGGFAARQVMEKIKIKKDQIIKKEPFLLLIQLKLNL